MYTFGHCKHGQTGGTASKAGLLLLSKAGTLWPHRRGVCSELTGLSGLTGEVTARGSGLQADKTRIPLAGPGLQAGKALHKGKYPSETPGGLPGGREH